MRTARDPIPASDLPLVSAIIPAYNSERYIADTIDSILQQDYPALEIWVVDDGSVDNTQAIGRGSGDKVQQASPKNKGSAAARNFGILNAYGKYIEFMDVDDVWCKHKIILLVAALSKGSYKMACNRFILRLSFSPQMEKLDQDLPIELYLMHPANKTRIRLLLLHRVVFQRSCRAPVRSYPKAQQFPAWRTSQFKP